MGIASAGAPARKEVEREFHMTRNWIAAALLVSATSIASAEEKAPKPGPEVERLGFFVGKWKTSGELKESPFMPAGKYTEKSTCEWFSGKFSVVCKIKGKGPMGPLEGLGIMGWSTEEKVYVYYGVDNSPMAWASVPRGTFADGVWTYDDESKMGGKMVKSRYVIKQTGKNSYSGTWSVMGPDGKWQLVMEATSTRE
jgi:hypothetical protein